jgi:hypothetical protein
VQGRVCSHGWGRLTLTKGFDDKSEAQECHEHDIEFVEAAEDASKALEPAKQALDFIAPTAPGLLDLPRLDAQRMRSYDRNEPQIESQLSCFISRLIRA